MKMVFCNNCKYYHTYDDAINNSYGYCDHPNNKGTIGKRTYLSKYYSENNRNYKAPSEMNKNNNCTYYRGLNFISSLLRRLME